jgi:hypothetical protein
LLAAKRGRKYRVESKVSLNEFKSNLNLVKAYIVESSSKSVTRIEYRTFDEGMCDANLFVLPKAEAKDDFEAFITLCNFQLHFYEDWLLTDTTWENADSIVNLWMQPEVEGYSFVFLSPAEVHKEVDWVIRAIKKLLSENQFSEKKAKDLERWGVYVNGESTSIDTTLDNFGISKVISGIGFNLEWNSIDIMYQTQDSYVLFSWGTGA